MRRIRLGVVFILLVVILLMASVLFGILTYWPSAKAPPTAIPNQGGTVPGEDAFLPLWKGSRAEMKP